ncbi:MAG: hypothetical protein R2712_24955 [Vicinamibacterales bacterium]
MDDAAACTVDLGIVILPRRRGLGRGPEPCFQLVHARGRDDVEHRAAPRGALGLEVRADRGEGACRGAGAGAQLLEVRERDVQLADGTRGARDAAHVLAGAIQLRRLGRLGEHRQHGAQPA